MLWVSGLLGTLSPTEATRQYQWWCTGLYSWTRQLNLFWQQTADDGKVCATQGQCTSPSVTYQVESHRAKTDKEEISPNNYEGLVDWVLFIVWKCLMWLPFFEHFLFTLRETKAFSRVHNLYQCMKCFSTDLLSNWSLCQGLLCKLISLQAALFAIFFSFKLFFFWIVLLSS